MIDVVLLDGRQPAVIIDAGTASELAGLLYRVHAQHLHRGHLPMPALDRIVEALAVVARISSANGTVPRVLAGGPREWETTTEVAAREGITDRAVRKQAEQGRRPGATRTGAGWLLPITPEAS